MWISMARNLSWKKRTIDQYVDNNEKLAFMDIQLRPIKGRT